MIIVTLFTLKGMLRWLIQRIKAVLLYIVYVILFVDTVNTKIKACNALNAMIVKAVNATVKTHPHIPAHNFLNIQLIFNPQKVLERLYHQCYICQYCRYKTRISNAFNDIYVDTVDTKHIHTFLPITFLIFNQFSIHKKF